MLPARGGVYTGRVASDGKKIEWCSLPSDCWILFRKKMGELQARTTSPENNKAGTLVSPVSIVTLSQRLMRLWRRQSQPKADAIPTDGWRAPLAQ